MWNWYLEAKLDTMGSMMTRAKEPCGQTSPPPPESFYYFSFSQLHLPHWAELKNTWIRKENHKWRRKRNLTRIVLCDLGKSLLKHIDLLLSDLVYSKMHHFQTSHATNLQLVIVWCISSTFSLKKPFHHICNGRSTRNLMQALENIITSFSYYSCLSEITDLLQ